MQYTQSSKKAMSNYKSNGFPVRQQEADKRMEEIEELNKKNSDSLKKIKLYTFAGQLESFPPKFSNDLADIQKTIQIEQFLIKKIHQLQDQKANQQTKLSNVIGDLQTQLNGLQKRLEQQEKIRRDHQKKLNEAQELCEKQKKFLADVKKLENQIKLKNQLIQSLEFDLDLSRTYLSDLRQEQNNLIAKSKKTYIKVPKGVEEGDDFKPPKIINTDWCQSEANKNLTSLQKFYSQNFDSLKKDLTDENEKLKNWISKFISKVENILKIKLQKLRQCGQTEQQIFINYKYMSLLHLNLINSFEKNDFPFAQMLDDFERVVRESDEYKFQLDSMSLASQGRILDREIVTNAVNALRQFNSVIIEEFLGAEEQKRKLAEEYLKFLKPELDGIQWVEQYDVRDMKRFIEKPSTILKKLEEDFIQMKGKKEKIMKELGSSNSLFSKMDASHNRVKQFIDPANYLRQREVIRNQVSLDRQERMLSMRQQVEKSMPLRGNESQEELARRQREIDLEVAMRRCRDRFKRISIEEELERIDDQIRQGAELQTISQEYSQVIRRGGNYGDDKYPRKDKPSELEIQLQKIIEENQQNKKNNYNEDIEI